jgi:hypothetical protein
MTEPAPEYNARLDAAHCFPPSPGLCGALPSTAGLRRERLVTRKLHWSFRSTSYISCCYRRDKARSALSSALSSWE